MMAPALGSRNFVNRLTTVVLPAPFGPISAWMVPRRILRSTPCTAVKPRNSFVKPRVSRIKSSKRKPPHPTRGRYCFRCSPTLIRRYDRGNGQKDETGGGSDQTRAGRDPVRSRRSRTGHRPATRYGRDPDDGLDELRCGPRELDRRPRLLLVAVSREIVA